MCLFSYGQTGSGKTHTMLGNGNGDERGIIPRSVEKVLETSKRYREKGWEYDMQVRHNTLPVAACCPVLLPVGVLPWAWRL